MATTSTLVTVRQSGADVFIERGGVVLYQLSTLTETEAANLRKLIASAKSKRASKSSK